MSTKDISRYLFQPRKHYVGMRMQQGRVLMDSDHNEGAWHDDEDQRRTLLELIGPQGSPDGGFFIGYTSNPGIGGTPLPITNLVNPGTTAIRFNNEGTDIQVPNYYVMPGSMYVGGMRVELEEPEHIAFQQDYLQNSPILGDIPSDLSSSATVAHHFFFLNVWEQCVTAVEDEEFLERALGGPDTSVRVRRMRRVEFLLANTGEDCITALERALDEQTDGLGEFVRETGELRSPGRLWIDFAGGDTEDTCAPCHPDPTGRYLGAENQAIRIMLVDPTHFVWAYDNASPLYRVTIAGVSDAAGERVVTMLTLPKDEEHWPLKDRVVEIVPWSAVLENGEKVAEEIGVFLRVSKSFTPDGDDVDDPKTFRIEGDAATMTELNDLIHAWDNDHPQLADLDAGSEPRRFYVRFWHQVQGTTTPVLIPTSSLAQLGTTGLVPNFTQPGLRGDFWIAALRPETPDRVVPFDLHTNEAGVPPHGPRHFYAPLAMIHSSSSVVTGVEDCRKHIQPVTDQKCCTVVVGDGVHSHGQFTSIQAAINALPPQGGEVCIRPGLYREEFILNKRDNVVISGCGDQTVLESPSVPAAAALVNVSQGFNLTIRSLKIRCTGQRAIFVHNANTILLTELKVEAVPPSNPATPDNDPVIDVEDCGAIVMQTLDIAASRRTGIDIQNTGDSVPARMSDISIRGPGISGTSLPPAGPLTRIRFGHFVLNNWRMRTYGQVGIESINLTIAMHEMDMIADHFSAAVRARSLVDQVFGTITIEDSRLEMRLSSIGGVQLTSEDAVVAIYGDIVFERNEVFATAGAWGGVQIRTGSTIIRGNHIRGGAGHGITLGSAIWINSTNASDSRRLGAGAGQLLSTGQVTGNLRAGLTIDGVLFFPLSEAPLGRIDIEDNLIEQMGTNGISVLTLLGWPFNSALPALNEGGRIGRNRIISNVTNPFGSMTVAEPLLPVGGSRFGALPGYNVPLRMLPLGGIVLGGAVSTSPATVQPLELEICDNIVQDNATGELARTLPLCGIFVLAGNGIRIARNRVARNGVLTQPTDVLQTGIRAGIAVLLAGAPAGTRDQIAAFLNDTLPRPPSSYALSVSGNTVEQREGRALFAVGTGPMAIENNALSSLGFHGSKVSPEAQAEITAIGDVVYVHNLGRPWESVELDNSTANSGLPIGTTGLNVALPYLKDRLFEYSGEGNLFFVGLGGQTRFANNQVVYDWQLQQVGSEALSLAPVALISLDHIGVHSNQFGFRLRTGALALPAPPIPASGTGIGGRPVLTHVLALGYTVNVSDNRVSEGLDDCEASIMSIGWVMNVTSSNLLTHCATVHATHGNTTFSSGNLELIRPSGTGCTSVQTTLADFVDDFVVLLYDRRV